MANLPKFSAALLHPRYWLTWLDIGILWLIVQLPYPALFKLGCALGRLALRLMKHWARIVSRDLELCFPQMSEQERQQMVVKNFESVGIGVMEAGMVWLWPDKRIPRWTEVIGMEHIRDAQAQKRGILLVGLYFLTLELSARQFGLQEPGIGVYRPNDNPLLDWLQTQGRIRSNKLMFDRKNPKGIIKTLKKGEVVWYAPDHDYGPRASVFAPLFAVKQAATASGTWMLSRMSNACLVSFVPRRKPDDKEYQLIMLPPECSPPLENAETTTAWMNEIVEQCIMMAPEQYMWLRRRFKTCPEGSPSLY